MRIADGEAILLDSKMFIHMGLYADGIPSEPSGVRKTFKIRCSKRTRLQEVFSQARSPSNEMPWIRSERSPGIDAVAFFCTHRLVCR